MRQEASLHTSKADAAQNRLIFSQLQQKTASPAEAFTEHSYSPDQVAVTLHLSRCRTEGCFPWPEPGLSICSPSQPPAPSLPESSPAQFSLDEFFVMMPAALVRRRPALPYG